MTLPLTDILALVGRLDDTPGFDSARERFRRFLADRLTTVSGLESLLEQCQEQLTEPHVRARQDLVVFLGRFLGFEPVFGTYAARDGSARVDGQWRSGRLRLLLDVRSERTGDDDIQAFARTLAALAAAGAADGDEWVGLSVLTPFYVGSQTPAMRADAHEGARLRTVSLGSLLWLAHMHAGGRLLHADVVRLLTSGPDSDFMIDLMRRLAGGDHAAVPAADAPPPSPRRRATDQGATSLGPEPVPPSPGPDLVASAGVAPVEGARYWIASLARDESATPEQVLDSVIRRRQILGVSDAGPFPTDARPGDRVCFAIAGRGLVGHARLDGVIADASSLIRGARRFTAVFRLGEVTIFHAPVAIDARPSLERALQRTPFNASGAVLSRLDRDEYEQLIAGPTEPLADDGLFLDARARG